VRVRVPPGAMWAFPSTDIHGGTGYNPRNTGAAVSRVVLYQAMMMRSAFHGFTSVRTTPYYRLLLANVYHKYNASRAEHNDDGVAITSSGRKHYSVEELNVIVESEVERLCSEEPELCSRAATIDGSSADPTVGVFPKQGPVPKYRTPISMHIVREISSGSYLIRDVTQVRFICRMRFVSTCCLWCVQ
jgi:hypothetical protein